MKRRLTMELSFSLYDVSEALRARYPEIPQNAPMKIIWHPGVGPGSITNKHKTTVHPMIAVTFDLPEEKPKS